MTELEERNNMVVASRKVPRPWEIFANDPKSVDTVDHVAFVNNNHINHVVNMKNHNNNNVTAVAAAATKKKDTTSCVVIDHHHRPHQLTGNGGSNSASNTLKKSKTAFKHMTVAKLFGKNYDIKKSLVYKNKKPVESPKPQRKTSHEKFYGLSWEDPIVRHCEEKNASDMHDQGPKPFRTLSRSVGKLLRRNYSSVDISIPDPEYKVAYLGNVLTGWAKGDGCADKPLSTLWKNYMQNKKTDVVMRLKVCPSGLKASTKQHGLTEYWAHRITFCSAPKDYPRVFCWIYRHEGKKLRHELRCHAVICSKDTVATDVYNQLKENLEIALREFKREKVNKQNARLSLANALYENPSMPKRKIMLSVGGTNYRPPLERSKSAPKLTSIEEAIGEEDENEEDECEELEIGTPVVSDKPTGMSLERPRRQNSMRRRHNYHRPSRSLSYEPQQVEELNINTHVESSSPPTGTPTPISGAEHQPLVDHQSSDEDFDEFLKKNSYDSNEVLCTDFLTYLNLRLDESPGSGHDQSTTMHDNESSLPHNELLEMSDDFSAPSSLVCLPKKSEGDGGSLSSGCETSSSITAIMDDVKTTSNRGMSQEPYARRRYESTSEAPQKCVSFQRSVTIPAPGMRNNCFPTPATIEFREAANNLEIIDSDSDESGYVEFQEQPTTLFKETCT